MSSFLELCEGETRNRWRDGQVCPDVRQGTMAPWARRLGCVLACYAQIGRGRGRGGVRERRRKERKVERERTEGEDGRRDGERGRMDGKREERESERESGARLVWRKELSPEIGVKKTMNAGGFENGNMN
ncbi:hypothetical protein TNCV_488711 [Trichonephila clavipes]|nr:hypothetical protein TNCV_488711 [Trichonephila clavipes]